MTSEQLYNLVRDVRRDAWPEGVSHWAATGQPHFYKSGRFHLVLEPEEAKALFFTSMLERVVELGGTFGEPLVEETHFVVLNDKKYEAPTLIAALAAALKEVAP